MDDNFCSCHDDLIKLILIDDLVKVCDNCNAKYPIEYNYCIQCSSNGKLVNLIDVKDIKINPNNYYNFSNHLNNFTDINDLLSDENIQKLEEFNLSKNQFNDIIDNIKKTYKTILDMIINKYSIDFNSLSVLDKMLLFSKSFVKTFYKEGGGDLGHFEFNEIYIDDRAISTLQITTIIHELSHFLLAEILEQIISILLDCNKTEAIEGFVCYNLACDDFNYLIDEYCAHTVEGRFAQLGYQDYSSYKSVLNRFINSYGEEYIEVANGVGNTFAYYIKGIMTSFIDDDLREDIKLEFLKINDNPKYGELQYETSQIFEWERFSTSIKLILTKNIHAFIGNPMDMEKIDMYVTKFKKSKGE